MAQIFRPSSNTLTGVVIGGILVLVLGGLAGTYAFNKTPFVTQVGVAIAQPVPFSHEHHVKGLGLDCRYCHTSVETAGYAGMPPTYTCMTCHSQVWGQAAMLEPVRTSMALDRPMRWNRVHDLPDFVYFDHSIHVNKGVGCVSCHGEVDKMPLVWRTKHLSMEWCLSCHRNPEAHLRPLDKITDLHWQAPDQLELGKRLLDEYHIPLDRLTNCSTCHR